jgi:hypothetical protein
VSEAPAGWSENNLEAIRRREEVEKIQKKYTHVLFHPSFGTRNSVIIVITK